MSRLRTVFRNVDPATAKQIADECGGDIRVVLAAVDLLQTEPRSLRALSVSVPIDFFHLVGRVIHTEPLPNDVTGVCERRHAPGAVAQAFAGHGNALPLVQNDCRRTIADPAVLAFAEHHICDADVLFRASFNQPALDAAAFRTTGAAALPARYVCLALLSLSRPSPRRPLRLA